jgi:hypothetical protein
MATEKQKDKLEYWKILIQEQKSSSLNVAEWCEQNNVSRRKYYYWLNRIRKGFTAETDSELNKPVNTETNTFIEIQSSTSMMMSSMPNKSKPAAIINKNGLEIEILDNASSAFIRKLMEAMKNA